MLSNQPVKIAWAVCGHPVQRADWEAALEHWLQAFLAEEVTTFCLYRYFHSEEADGTHSCLFNNGWTNLASYPGIVVKYPVNLLVDSLLQKWIGTSRGGCRILKRGALYIMHGGGGGEGGEGGEEGYKACVTPMLCIPIL